MQAVISVRSDCVHLLYIIVLEEVEDRRGLFCLNHRLYKWSEHVNIMKYK